MKKYIYNKFLRVFLFNPIYLFLKFKKIKSAYLFGFESKPVLINKEEYSIVLLNEEKSIILKCLFKEIEISSFFEDELALLVNPDDIDEIESLIIDKGLLKCKVIPFTQSVQILDLTCKTYIYLNFSQNLGLDFSTLRSFINRPLFIYLEGELKLDKKSDGTSAYYNSNRVIESSKFHSLF